MCLEAWISGVISHLIPGSTNMQDKIVDLLEIIYKNPERFTSHDLTKRFSKETFDHFTSICSERLARKNDEKWKITLEGAKFYLESKRQEQQATFNKLATIASIALAIVAGITLLYELIKKI